MNSHRVMEQLELYLSGELSDEEVAVVEAWLRDDPAAAKMLATANRMVSQLDTDLRAPVGTDELATRIIGSLDAHVVCPVPRRRKVMLWATGLAAAAIVLFAATTVLFQRSGDSGAASNEVLSGNVMVDGTRMATVSEGSTISVAGETPAAIRLADGSQAEFAPGTRAVLHGRAKGQRQLVELVEGGGTFRVKKAHGNFRVETRLGSVTALGTEFSVRLLSPQDPGEPGMRMRSVMLAVAVISGTVRVELSDKTFLLNGGESRVFAAEQKSAPVMVQDFEKANPAPTVWVVGIPNENASIGLSTDHPFQGKQCMKLHYHFTGDGQYLGIPQPLKIHSPVHKLRFMLYGDNSGSGYGVYLADAGGETHKYRNSAVMKIDFKGWKEIVVDLDAPHENWGGDKNGKIDYPITTITFEISTPGKAVEGDLFFDAIRVDSDASAEETLNARQVSVVSPAYCSDVKGDTPIMLAVTGFKSVTAKCWKPGGEFGSNSTVATVAMGANGKGSFVFPADAYPHGPITITISGQNGAAKDNCYLQLYNKGGVSWNEGMPKDPPPAAKEMSLLFADDFKGPLSISSTDPKATYYDHKPPNGSQDFSSLRFTGHDEPNNPFAQVDSYLRIRANEKTHSAGLISSVKSDGKGIKASLPCYFECRLMGPNAIGTWPAFWLLTDNLSDPKFKACDELDIIEAYGGEGPGHPNSYDKYMITPHCWEQGPAGNALGDKAFKALKNPCCMRKFGIPSTWYEAMHTYGCKVTESETIYYCDNIEVGRHETFPVCKQKPLFFLINLATGGGWPVDLSRYGMTDMYVDYVRVYQGKK